jgi:hypothetical protein
MQIVIALLISGIPAVALAAPTFASLVGRVVGVINLAIPVLSGLIILTFLWGITRYVFSNAEAEKGKSKAIMGWGLVALFVVFSIWGIVAVFERTILQQ